MCCFLRTNLISISKWLTTKKGRMKRAEMKKFQMRFLTTAKLQGSSNEAINIIVPKYFLLVHCVIHILSMMTYIKSIY